MSDLVTAILPVYNGEKYIASAIETVLAQTYPQVECIVIDDGSKDGTAEVCESFGDRIRFIRKENGGVATARNLGVKEAKGKYVAFLDADDKWTPEKTTKQVAELEATGAAVCLTGVGFIDGDDNLIGSDGVADHTDLLRNILLLGDSTGFVGSTAMISRDVIRSVGGFDERLSTSADADLMLRISRKHRIEGINEPLALYRHHTGQMHHNLLALEHDFNLILKEFYNSPVEDELPTKNQAFARLESTLGIGYLSKREFGRASKHLLSGMRHNPVSTLGSLAALMRHKVAG